LALLRRKTLDRDPRKSGNFIFTERHVLGELKGIAEVIMVCLVGERIVSLLTYPDGSWGIKRGTETVGVWEPNEQRECYLLFCKMCELGETLGLSMGDVLLHKDRGTLGQGWNASVN
jgi:hypothetical protein